MPAEPTPTLFVTNLGQTDVQLVLEDIDGRRQARNIRKDNLRCVHDRLVQKRAADQLPVVLDRRSEPPAQGVQRPAADDPGAVSPD